MTCTICKYEWCWVCGLPHRSVIHYAQFGGVGCELIGWITLKNRGCCLQLILIFLIFLALPFLVLFISFCLGIGGLLSVFFKPCFERGIHRLGRSISNDCGMTNKYMCVKIFWWPIKALFQLCYVIIWIVMMALLLSMGAIGGSLIYAITVVPTMLIYVFTVIKK